jgi:hypothetical protein
VGPFRFLRQKVFDYGKLATRAREPVKDGAKVVPDAVPAARLRRRWEMWGELRLLREVRGQSFSGSFAAREGP